MINLKIRTFNLHWLTGDVEKINGPDLDNQLNTLTNAVNNTGIGGGALGGIDYWEETTDMKEDDEKQDKK